MEKKKTKVLVIILLSIIVCIIGWLISNETIVFPIFAIVLVGIILAYMLSTGKREVIEDERTYKIGEKASRRTIQVVAVLTGVMGIGFILISNLGFLDVADTGYSLAYVACGLLIVYMIFFRYYTGKYGG
jgi:uncharacterized membrane protein